MSEKPKSERVPFSTHCHICGRKLASRNNTGECFSHSAPDTRLTILYGAGGGTQTGRRSSTGEKK